MVTQKEIIEALRGPIGAVGNAKRKELANRIEAEGIAPPDGMVLVPSEPTAEMREAGNVALLNIKADQTPAVWDKAFYTYRAMLAAAPKGVR